jgi:ATP-dependent Lon protease
MVTTRSRSKLKSIGKIKNKPTTNKIKKKVNLTLKESNSDSESDSEYVPSIDNENDDDESLDFEEMEVEDIDDEILFEESFELPLALRNNEVLKTRFDSIVSKIKDKTPTLEQILKLRIRPKRKMDLLEKYYIYRYSMYPHSEEKFYMKKELNQAIIYAKKEYKEFIEHKTKFLNLEKHEKKESDITLLKKKLFTIDTCQTNLSILYQAFNSLESRDNHSDEFVKRLQWIKLSLKLPFNNIKTIPIEDSITKFLMTIQQKLDSELYGMKKVKESLLLYIHDRLMNPNTKSAPLALIGNPGIGKTSIAQCLSQCLSLPFQQIALGGIADSSFLSGHDSTYIGSKPGRISMSLIQAGFKNPIIFFDEFDKVENQDILNSLLHITDTSQNKKYHDSYFGSLSIDLSTCWFICSMNEKPRDRALSDRMSYIYIDDYTEKDKAQIVKKYLLPKALRNVCIGDASIQFESNDTIDYLVKKVSPGNSGIRKLKESITVLISKLSFIINNAKIETSFSLPISYKEKLQYPFKVTNEVIDKLLHEFESKTNASFTHLYV